MADPNADQPVRKHIEHLVDVEHRLHGEKSLTNPDHRRLKAVQVELDRCWDLLSRRRQGTQFKGGVEMKTLLAFSVGLVVVGGLAHGMDPSFATGDRKLDSTLAQLNVAARADPDDFVRRLSSMHDVPEQELRHARDTFGLQGADLFMATGLARETHRPVRSVAEEFKQGKGKSWGVLAQNLGIRPGSTEFHQLKRDAKGSLNYMNSTAKSKQKHEQKMKKASQGQGHGKSRL